MKEDNITNGCTATLYCPSDYVTRGEMAVFMMRAAFNLLLPNSMPIISSVSQTTIDYGTTSLITVIGQNTHFAQGVTEVNTVTGLATGLVTVLSPEVLTVQVTAQAGAYDTARIWATNRNAASCFDLGDDRH